MCVLRVCVEGFVFIFERFLYQGLNGIRCEEVGNCNHGICVEFLACFADEGRKGFFFVKRILLKVDYTLQFLVLVSKQGSHWGGSLTRNLHCLTEHHHMWYRN